MSRQSFAAEGAFKPLAGVELRSLSREDKNSQDERDMAVLGRAQELNVSRNHPYLDLGTKLNSITTAQLSFYFDAGICVHVDEHVGNLIDVRSPPQGS